MSSKRLEVVWLSYRVSILITRYFDEATGEDLEDTSHTLQIDKGGVVTSIEFPGKEFNAAHLRTAGDALEDLTNN